MSEGNTNRAKSHYQNKSNPTIEQRTNINMILENA